MLHPSAGFSGMLLGLLVFPALYSFLYFTKQFDTYNLDPQGKAHAF